MTEAEARTIERLRAGAGTYACGGYLAALDGLQRTEICTALIFDRLQRKMRTVETLHGEADGNWNQTFYLLYFRTLGDRQNQEAFLRLARKVPYKIVLRERLAPHAVEAMLLGASGLLELYRGDAYTLDLRRSFEYLAAKYGIEATDASEWALTEIRPANHPVLRLAQAAEFFAQDEFVMARAMACRTEEDIRRLFCIEASPYWRTHHVPGAERRKSQAHRGVQGQHHRNQPRRRPAIRLRKLHRQRTFARQRPDAPRTPAGRRQPLHARMAGRRRASAQRLRIAGPAATGHRILRRTPLRGMSRRTADRKKPRRRLTNRKK